MARPLRMDYEGAWYHVMNRGIEGREVFLNDDDRRRFLRLLSELEENFCVEVHGYCLMENHFHLRKNRGQSQECALILVGRLSSSKFSCKNLRFGR